MCTLNDSLFCCALLRGTARWSSCVGQSSGPLEVAKGIKGSGPRLTFDLKRALLNEKMKPEKIELESTRSWYFKLSLLV